MQNHPDSFVNRHLGPNASDLANMFKTVGIESLDQLMDETVPDPIRLQEPLPYRSAMSEYEYLRHIRQLAAKNTVMRSCIGMGYYDTITPAVIQRNIFENPGWYTQYTPYQAEIAQGRLEALLNFQTMTSDLTGLPVANASLLDEATAAAEAMSMTHSQRSKKVRNVEANTFLVDVNIFPQTLDVLRTRASGQGFEVKVQPWQEWEIDETVFAGLVQFPNADGAVEDYRELADRLHENKSYLVVAADLMALTLLEAPGHWGADVVLGSAQRFGVPMGYGGPHAAYFTAQEEFLRLIPGRIIGVSVDRLDQMALRMALQTREQHIRRDKATSNICTAQALLAIMAGMYGVYHGPEGVKAIARRMHAMAVTLHQGLVNLGLKQMNGYFFDTLTVEVESRELAQNIHQLAVKEGYNLRQDAENTIGISLDETTSAGDVLNLIGIFAKGLGHEGVNGFDPHVHVDEAPLALPEELLRESEFMTHPVFNTHHSETAMMRYIKSLENKDLSLNTAMIPLGSCTMKLNAAAELMPVSFPEFAGLHPFAPVEQARGYTEMIEDLGQELCDITGFAGMSFQPNSGAQGEYTGLMVIRAWHHSRGDTHRDIALIPDSAHGTNPASAVMAGMKVVVVKTDENGNIDVDDLKTKAEQHRDNLAALMITYPSTYGVFERGVKDICQIIHDNGGQVYMDGANLNAQVGLTSPGFIGADVCHLNLHKTFAIPHGGGGPGMGPIGVAEHLVPFLPGHVLVKTGGEQAISAVAATPFGSASILLISYAYLKMLGSIGATEASRYAILNANYMKTRLQDHFQILYEGENGRVAHEFIVDLREFKHKLGLEVDDITKRLIDYGFHAPTVSWPVPGTIMIEPTESEPREELDRFCDAMIAIRQEITEVEEGKVDAEDNVLKNSPHTMPEVTADHWPHPYSRSKAAFPVESLRASKFWPSVARVNNTYGDRNVVCTCPPIEEYAEGAV